MSLFNYKPANSSATSGFTLSKANASADNHNNSHNSGSQPRVNQFDYAPKRFGLRFDPPTIGKLYLPIPSNAHFISNRISSSVFGQAVPS